MAAPTGPPRPGSDRPLRRVLRAGLPVVGAGLVVGVVVAVMAASLGLASCGPREAFVPFDARPSCQELVRSLATRTGVVAGLVTVFFHVLSLGLLRTALRMEEVRRLRALERYGQGGGPE